MMTYSMKVKDEQQKGKEYQLLQQGMGELGDLGVDPGKGGRISRGGADLGLGLPSGGYTDLAWTLLVRPHYLSYPFHFWKGMQALEHTIFCHISLLFNILSYFHRMPFIYLFIYLLTFFFWELAMFLALFYVPSIKRTGCLGLLHYKIIADPTPSILSLSLHCPQGGFSWVTNRGF